MNKFVAYLRQPEWSPYVAGAGLGVVTIIALLLSNALLPAPQLVGASGAYENLVAPVGTGARSGQYCISRRSCRRASPGPC